MYDHYFVFEILLHNYLTLFCYFWQQITLSNYSSSIHIYLCLTVLACAIIRSSRAWHFLDTVDPMTI